MYATGLYSNRTDNSVKNVRQLQRILKKKNIYIVNFLLTTTYRVLLKRLRGFFRDE